ncbi:uncharacterized protein TM35_000011270 [Trypanosoma theileri]|uniref:Uncharacterized protein n=1 Tax=Trypanosoma theileri TaxID=67003 RepID=A0A1X0P9W7_9TRYP|nr:uncharacterized protein TM35_000011270 [Trypanosoma theileri]ORC93250.1 hypothetical protein TM35_000011270 [Trypanosoma theileri]
MNEFKSNGDAGIKNDANVVYSDRLMHSECGITPAYGVEVRESRPHIHPQRFELGKEMQQRGKKHIDPQHMNLSDDAKREEGRYGKRHLQVGNNRTTTVEMGQQTTAPVRRGEGPRSKTISTSMQLSEARLRQIAKDPRYNQAASELLQHRGDPSIVHEEERLSRRVASEKYAQGSSARCAELRDQKRSDDLGSPAVAIKTRVPFALDASTPRADNVTVHRSAYYRNAESKQQERPRSSGLHSHRQLQDHVELSKNEYPDPPAVGVRVTPRFGHRPATAQTRPATCLDEEALRRAKARCHQSSHSRMPDFIFGAPQPLEAPRPTLRGITEERWKAAEERTAQRRTGRAMAHQSHKRTALW